MIYFINPCHIIPSATYSGFHTLTSVSIRQICLHCCSFSPLSSPFYILFPGTFSLYCQPRSAIRYFHPLAIPHYGACVFFSFLHDATSYRVSTSARIVGHPGDDDPIFFKPLPLPSHPSVRNSCSYQCDVRSTMPYPINRHYNIGDM